MGVSQLTVTGWHSCSKRTPPLTWTSRRSMPRPRQLPRSLRRNSGSSTSPITSARSRSWSTGYGNTPRTAWNPSSTRFPARRSWLHLQDQGYAGPGQLPAVVMPSRSPGNHRERQGASLRLGPGDPARGIDETLFTNYTKLPPNWLSLSLLKNGLICR
jgi:hypothetical protein